MKASLMMVPVRVPMEYDSVPSSHGNQDMKRTHHVSSTGPFSSSSLPWRWAPAATMPGPGTPGAPSPRDRDRPRSSGSSTWRSSGWSPSPSRRSSGSPGRCRPTRMSPSPPRSRGWCGSSWFPGARRWGRGIPWSGSTMASCSPRSGRPRPGRHWPRESWERRRRLFEEDGVGSELAYLEARYQAEQAEAQLATLRERLARTIIRAPIRGVVDERMVEVGTMVSAGTPVVRMVQIDPVKVQGGVPERFAGDVRAGASARVTFDVLRGEVFRGGRPLRRVHRESPQPHLRGGARAFPTPAASSSRRWWPTWSSPVGT
jgi:hypothetical protein